MSRFRIIGVAGFVVVALGLFVKISVEVLLYARHFGFADMPIFLEAARSYLQHGQLYSRDLSAYGAGEAIYKYPPFFASLLLPWVLYASDEVILYLFWGLQLVTYVATLLLMWWIWRPARHRLIYTLFFLIPGFLFGPFFETLYGLQLETFILALFVVAIWLLQKNKNISAGFILSLAGILKVYPVFMALYFFSPGKRNGFLGFVNGIFIFLFFGLLIFGFRETYFYVKDIFPALLGEGVVLNRENMNIAKYFSYFLGVGSQSIFVSKGIFLFLMIFYVWHFFIKNKMNVSLVPVSISLLIVLSLLYMSNSWANYQLLLLLPLVVLLGYSLDHKSPLLFLAYAVSMTLLLFSENARVNNFYFLPWSWTKEFIWLRGLVPLILYSALMRVFFLRASV